MTESMERVIRIILVDDHELMRKGLRLLIEQYPDLHIIDETHAREQTLEAVQRHRPDIVLLDLDLGRERGLDFIPELRHLAPQTRIIVLTGIRDPATHQQAIRLGAVGLLLKDHSPTVLVQAIRQVMAGNAWIDPALVASLVTELSRTVGERHPEEAKLKLLTEREREVITLVCEGLQNKTIARRLSISDTTVRHHLTSIFSKLELENRLELVIYAYKHNLAQVKP